MRLGVLDVGSNTVHLLVVDAHRGAHPTPMTSEKSVLRLAEQISGTGHLPREGADELVESVAAARDSARRLDCDDLVAFATSAIREADNSTEVLERVRAETGVDLQVLPGEDEARYTFLAARRWFGWSAGQLLLLDIGGGSLEIAVGMDEAPDLAVSLPLGAGRVRRSMLPHDRPNRDEIRRAREWLDDELAPVAKRISELGVPDRVVATSKTFRSLARLTGAAPANAGPRVRRTLTDTGLSQLLTFITRMSADDLAGLNGVSAARSHQLVSGALVADATMRALSLTELEICPWALREGVILHRLDRANGEDRTGAQVPAEGEEAGSPPVTWRTGRKAQHRARWDR